MKKVHYLLPFLVIFFLSCSRQTHIANIERTQYTVGKDSKDLSVNEELLDIISPYKRTLDEEMNTEIGTVATAMNKRKPESELTHWMGDVLYRQASQLSGMDIDFALMNYGGIRLPYISAGSITTRTVYELMPFDNYVVILELDGRTVRSIFEKIAASGGGWPVSKHVLMVISDNRIDKLMIGGAMVDDDRIYKMVTSNFLADAGDGLNMLPDKKRYEYDVLIREAIINDIKQMSANQQPVKSTTSGRITIKP